MPISLYSVQKAIQDKIKADFPAYPVKRHSVLNDEIVMRDENGQVLTFIALRFSPLRPGGGKSMGGVRLDEYYSTCDVNVISSTEDWAAQTLDVVRDDLLGWAPEGGERLHLESGTADFPIRNTSNRPPAYASSQRFRFQINQSDPRLRMTPA